jgi:uncharacterized protein with PQ loop repeat
MGIFHPYKSKHAHTISLLVWVWFGVFSVYLIYSIEMKQVPKSILMYKNMIKEKKPYIFFF